MPIIDVAVRRLVGTCDKFMRWASKKIREMVGFDKMVKNVSDILIEKTSICKCSLISDLKPVSNHRSLNNGYLPCF